MREAASLPLVAQRFIQRVTPFCSSVVLGGSRASGNAQPNSDVDLCLICPDSRCKGKVLTALRSTIKRANQGRALIDAKVFTEDEFKHTIQSLQNPHWFTFFQEARLLHGTEINVPLFRHLFRDAVWQATEEVREAIDYVERSLFWNVACYKLWTALSTCFTVECLSRGRSYRKSDKIQLLQRLLGSLMSLIREGYESVRWQRRRQLSSKTRDEKGQTLTMDLRTAQKRSEGLEQENLLQAAGNVLSYAESLYRKLES